jgi:hypothetical protein
MASFSENGFQNGSSESSISRTTMISQLGLHQQGFHDDYFNLKATYILVAVSLKARTEDQCHLSEV